MDFNGRQLRVDFSDPAHRSTANNPAANANRQPTNALASHFDRSGGGGGGGGYSAHGAGPVAGQSQDELRRIFSNTSAAPAAAMPASAPLPPMPSQQQQSQQQHHQSSSSAVLSDVVPPSVFESTIGFSAPAVPPAAAAYGTDTVLKLVQSLTKNQLLEILSEMKKFAHANPEGARQLLFDSPQVAQTLLHILILFGLVRPADVQAIQTTARPVAGTAPPLALPHTQQQQQQQQQQLPLPPQQAYAQPAQAMYGAPLPPPSSSLPYPPPPPVGLAPPPPPVSTAAAAAAAAAGGGGGGAPAFTEQDMFMLREISKLSAEQIQQLPGEVQQKIALLKQQLEAQGR